MSTSDVMSLLIDRREEVIWPSPNCGGAHVFPPKLNVKTEHCAGRSGNEVRDGDN